MSEIQIQAQCYTWFHNTFPHLRGLLCYNLNNSRNKVEGNKNKTLGLQAGRSDMVLYFAGKATMIELKTDNGIQSQAQKQWQALIQDQGFSYVVIRSLSEFQQFVTFAILPDKA